MRIYYIFVLAMFSLCFAIFLFAPIKLTTAEVEHPCTECSFDEFEKNLSKMLDYNNVLGEDDDITTVSALDINENKSDTINRLIVYSEKNVDSFGAVLKAEYKNWHIFQYSDYEKSCYAFEQFTNSGFDVSFDCVVNTDGEIEDNATESNANLSYRSWGADYVGYSNYTDTMLRLYEQQNLQDMTVAVVDSGINASHELFSGRLLTPYAKNFTEETSYNDLNGHGTHVSGTIAEATLSNVKILPLKVLNYAGKGYVASIVEAIEYAITLKETGLNITVMNMSIGIDTSSSTRNVSVQNVALENVVIDAYNAGIIPVVSAGNDSTNTSYACPANVNEAITVSALKRSTNGNLVFDSSYSNFGKEVDFSAPGTSIESAGISSNTSYVRMSGTSMATPHVSACVALVLSNPHYKDYDINQVITLLAENAVDYGAEGKDAYYGYGCVNIANIGALNYGNVIFSETEKFHDQTFSLSLSFTDAQVEGTPEIYYTITTNDGTLESQLYKSPISINKTSKVTAIAYVNNAEKNLLQKSIATTYVYYFDNVDLLENYSFETSFKGIVISKYTGQDLETLKVQSLINGRYVVGIKAYAFSNSKIKNLYLPDSITYFDNYSFSGNALIEQIHCASSAVEVGSYAFNRCTELAVFDVSNVTNVGIYAFAYCSSLSELNLMQATSIGRHAVSGSGIERLYLGKNLSSLGEQSSLTMLTDIYGVSGANNMSVSEKLAYDLNVNFINLALRITKDFSSSVIVHAQASENDATHLSLSYVGYQTRYEVYLDGMLLSPHDSVSVQSVGGKYEKVLDIMLVGLSLDNHTVKVVLFDDMKTRIESKTVQIQAIDDNGTTYRLFTSGTHFNIIADGDPMEQEQVFLKSSPHNFQIVADSGYTLESVMVDGVMQDLSENKEQCSFTLNNVFKDVNVVVQTNEKEVFSISFSKQQHGRIYINETEVNGTVEVQRDGNLTFKVVPEDGYRVRRVHANGQRFSVIDGFCTINNITDDMQIEIVFEACLYKVKLSLGKGGNISAQGGAVDGDLQFGASRVYVISANEGYEIDTVTVNGKEVEVVNGTFTVDNVGEDCEIVVSFKETEKSIFAKDSVMLIYIFIFLAMLFVFALAKVILAFVRKKEAEKKRKMRTH